MDDIRLLIVDSDSSNRGIIKECFISLGYIVDEASDGIAALKLFRRNEYNLFIIDSSITELDGRLVCNQIRKVSDAPIIITCQQCDEEMKMSYFDQGIDEFLVKPISLNELQARIKVFLRRTIGIKKIPARSIFCNGINIDTISRMVFINENKVQLTPKEYDLLLFLSQNPNVAFSRETLLNEVWGDEFIGSDRTVDTHIKTLRDSINPCHNCIKTIWGFGYKFEK